ncbi:MAG: potassium transporter TrkA, partial [Rhodothermaceae bacterium]|nr:potassium transporter TrkA [Rhodothermaceae bacterium]
DTDRFHIVAELNDAAWRPVAAMVGEEETELVFIHEVIARIIAQAARQTGLSVVVRELLTFEGNEFYFAPADSLAGRTYGEALFAFDDAEPVGIRTAEGVTLNPPPDQHIGATDDLVVLAEDDVHITRTDDDGDLSAAARGVDDAMLVAPVPPVAEPEHLLILGWSPRAPLIICTLNAYLEPGSTITVVTVREDAEAELAVQCAGLTNLTVAFQPGDPTDRALLNRLGIEGFDHVVVMSRSHAAPQAADTHALVTLLHLRDLAEQHGSAFNIVSEMNDVRNQALAEVTRADDFVVSDRLISLMVAQIAEKRQLADVFTELFSPVGAELYLRPASDYVVTGRPIPFYAVVEAARRRNETALGFRRGSDAYERNGLHLNPRGSAPVTFTADDRVILLANS